MGSAHGVTRPGSASDRPVWSLGAPGGPTADARYQGLVVSRGAVFQSGFLKA
jgi:hypothetical protein